MRVLIILYVLLFLTQMFLQLALLPLLGHKEVIGTLGYPIASKLENYLVSIETLLY